MSPSETETLRARRFGWSALLAWALAGLALEGLQGTRPRWYTSDELARTLLRLGHAHGVGLALLVLVYSSAGVPLLREREDGGRSVGARLRAGALLIPLGFFLGALAHPEGDPSLAVLAVPAGAAALLWALASLARAAWRAPAG